MRRNKRIMMAFALVVLFVSLCGCKKDNEQRPEVMLDDYEIISYPVAEVEKGTLSTDIVLKLNPVDVEPITYKLTDPMKVEKVFVSVGDTVKAGDVLVSFEAKEIKEELKEHQRALEEINYEIKHYKNLMNIDKDADYKKEISECEQSAQVEKTYIDEINKKLEGYEFVASCDGTVKEVSSALRSLNEFDMINIVLVAVVPKANEYEASAKSADEFEEGKTFKATQGELTCEMKVTSVKKSDDGVVIRFVPVGDNGSSAASFSIELKKDNIDGVLYTDSHAIHENDIGSYVYKVDESGCYEAVYVTTGETVDGKTVILSGLNEGDKVRSR